MIPDYLVYLDLPTIPEHLLANIQDIIDAPPKPKSSVSSDYHYFQTRLVSKELFEWASDLFKTECYTQYQIIREGIHIHKDGARDVAFNYIIEPGGDEVRTNMYDEEKQLLCSEVILPKTWHRLKTDVFHNVTGIVNDRVAVSVELMNYKWNDALHL